MNIIQGESLIDFTTYEPTVTNRRGKAKMSIYKYMYAHARVDKYGRFK